MGLANIANRKWHSSPETEFAGMEGYACEGSHAGGADFGY